MFIRSISLALLLLLGACTRQEVQFFSGPIYPERLSEWSLLMQQDGELVPNGGVIAYDLKSALFTDYAHKFRTVYVPPGAAPAEQLADGKFDLPVGSIVSKTFYYPKSELGLLKTREESLDFGANGLNLSAITLIETRLLVHTKDGWVGLPYIWNEAGTEAHLEVIGGQFQLAFADTGEEFEYAVPDFNQCQGCHIENLSSGGMGLVGFKAHHIDKGYEYLHKASNQLEHLKAQGLIEATEVEIAGVVDWKNESLPLEDRARSYLDINCGHCHNPVGPADTSGMFLNRTVSEPLRLGVCKPPVAAGQGTGGRAVGIHPGAPENSILAYRMNTLDLGAMMPELGRSLIHREGVALIEAWIGQMSGGC